MINTMRNGVKYGSLTHYMLNYAKMKSRIADGTFSIDEYREFRQKLDNITNLRRSINTLEKYGHIQKVSSNRYRFTEKGGQCIVNLREACKEKMTEQNRESMLDLKKRMAQGV